MNHCIIDYKSAELLKSVSRRKLLFAHCQISKYSSWNVHRPKNWRTTKSTKHVNFRFLKDQSWRQSGVKGIWPVWAYLSFMDGRSFSGGRFGSIPRLRRASLTWNSSGRHLRKDNLSPWSNVEIKINPFAQNLAVVVAFQNSR